MSRWILGLGFIGMASWLVRDQRRRANDRRIEREKQRRDELLDEALMESFPASDPPAPAHPHR